MRREMIDLGVDPLPAEDDTYDDHYRALKAARAEKAEQDARDAPEATDAPFYCPGCGRRWKFMTECRGMNLAAPHPPIEVVSTDELTGDPEHHTPAPDSPNI